MPYIYSTATSSTCFCFYDEKSPSDIKRILKRVTVNGGAGVASKHLVTPKGVATTVSDEELALLESHPLFNKMVANKFLTVEGKEVNIDKVVKNMEEKDRSAPKTPKDYQDVNYKGAKLRDK